MPANPPKLSFGNPDPSGQSPFGTINGNKPTSGFGGGLGSAFGGGSPFGSALGAGRTGNFATPGQLPITKSDKPAKPFGAPESDAEDDSQDDAEAGDEEGGGNGVAEPDKDKDKDKDPEKEKEKEKEDTASRDESTPVGGDDEKKKFKRGKLLAATNLFGFVSANNVRSRCR